MTRAARRLVPAALAGLIVAASAGVANAQNAPASAAPMAVTTDTRAYCERLHARLAITSNPPDEVRMLTVEGWRMCSQGHVIGGLARLRRAVTILRGGDADLDGDR